MTTPVITTGTTVTTRSHPEWGRGQVLTVTPHPQGMQAVVEFTSGRIERVPVGELEVQQDPVAALAAGQVGDTSAFDLRLFAAGLKTEHVRSGTLSNARLTPLPHQILLVDKIFSQNLWRISSPMMWASARPLRRG